MPDGCVLVRTSESFDGWLVNIMRKSMQKTLDESLIAWLNQLKRRAEEGEASLRGIYSELP
jgi:hypothetical protein